MPKGGWQGLTATLKPGDPAETAPPLAWLAGWRGGASSPLHTSARQVPSRGAGQALPLISSLHAGSGWPIMLSGLEQTSPLLAPLSVRFSCMVLGGKSALGTHGVYYICRNDTYVDKRGDNLGGNLKAQGEWQPAAPPAWPLPALASLPPPLV